MRMVVPADLETRAAGLIGVPWVPKGTDPATGWDCLGLGYWCLKHWCGVEVPSYGHLYDEAAITSPLRRQARAKLLADGLGSWREVEPQAGVICKLIWMGRIGHVGFMLSPTRVLHADRTCGTALLDLEAANATYRIAGAVVPDFITEILSA